MQSAERSWYLEQMGVPEWIPRDAAALIADAGETAAATGSTPQAVASETTSPQQVPAAVADSAGPAVTPAEILANLKAANGPKSKKQLAEEGSKLAEEFTRPPTPEQLKQLAPKPISAPAAKLAATQNSEVAQPTAKAVPPPQAIVMAPNAPLPESPAERKTAVLPDPVAISEPDFSVEETDLGDLEALFAESMAFEADAPSEVVDTGPDTIEKLDRDWKLMLAQAGCLPASLGEGVADPAVIVLTALPANQFDNRQLDRAWRLRSSILKAAKLPNKVCVHSALYSISSNVKPAPLLKRLRDLYPKATLLCFANDELTADLQGLPGEIIRLPSLDQMLADAKLKLQAWEQLQKAIPSFEKLA